MNVEIGAGLRPEMMNVRDQRRNLDRFGEQVLADPQLHDRLRAADGDAFPALAVKLAAERGLVFTAAVVQAALQEKWQTLHDRWI